MAAAEARAKIHIKLQPRRYRKKATACRRKKQDCSALIVIKAHTAESVDITRAVRYFLKHFKPERHHLVQFIDALKIPGDTTLIHVSIAGQCCNKALLRHMIWDTANDVEQITQRDMLFGQLDLELQPDAAASEESLTGSN